MAVATDITHFGCPRCQAQLEPQLGVEVWCHSCGWQGQAMLFRPLALQVEEAEAALPDDATCTHHPTKRAVAVCAGTGDYICALCSIEAEGETYSAQYLNTVGRDKAGKMFDRYLDRPDSTVILYMLLCFAPYVNVIWVLGMPIWIPLGYIKLAAANRLRHEDPLLGRLVSKGRLILLGVLLALLGCVMTMMIVSVIIALMGG